jgi:7,8-dihydropterin-6-yl-methyl-4-(beta-D-ribofuranosyl)aminobenzene 5'-phosphate synthase
MNLLRVLTRFVLCCVLFCPFLLPDSAHANDRVTILYDAFSDSKDVTKDWGFSVLLEHDGKRILFDTGNNAEIFRHNVESLGVDLAKLDFVVISHRHSDHTTGLKYLVDINPTVPIYVARENFGMFGGAVPSTLIRPVANLPSRMRYFDGVVPSNLPTGNIFRSGNFVFVDKLTEVAPGIYLVPTISKNAGTLELHELTLVIKGNQGLTLIDGCSHSGIEEILQAASAIDPHFHIIFGGLHLVATPEPEIDALVKNLKDKWKLDKIAPGHCTGEPAFLRLRQAFGENYLYAGAGTRIDVP